MSEIVITEEEQKRLLPILRILAVEMCIVVMLLGVEFSFKLYDLIK